MAILRGNGNQPYVHSNVERFNGRKTVSLTDMVVTSADVQSSITTLTNISNELKREADKFLMGMGVDTANAELLRLPNTYAGLAADIIQNRDVIASLIVSGSEGYISKSQLIDKLSKQRDRVTNKLLKELDVLDEEISVEKLSKLIAQSMGNAEGVLTQTGLKMTKFFKFDSSIEYKIVKEYNNNVFNRLRSSQGKIVQIIKELLLSSDITQKYNQSEKEHTVDKFMAKFREIFLKRAKTEVDFFYVNFSPEDYLKNLDSELRFAITKDITDFKNASGITNEDILVSVYKADTFTTLKLTATGSKSEEDIIKQFPSLHKMNTHHQNNKQSQTDVLIENKKGMIVRAQSKTSVSEYEYTIDNKSTTRILNHLQRTVNLYTLLTSLNETGVFPINNIDEICYAVANSLWFHTHISISGKREAGHFNKQHSDPQPGLLAKVVDALNVALARQVPYFMGISLKKTENEIITDVKGSNIFYIENGYLVPTYIELDEVIRDLQQYLDAMQTVQTNKTLKFTIEKQGVSWAYPKAENFWLEKFAHNIYDSAPGFEQGQNAIDSTRIHGNFSALLQYDSYKLG